MADTPYALGMNAMFNGTYNFAGGTMKLMLVNIAGGHYTPNFVTDQYLSAIASGDRISSTGALTGISVTAGTGPKSTFTASNTVFSSVSGSAAGAVVAYLDTGNPATSPLIWYFDSWSGLPITPDGSDINVTFSGSGIAVMT
jgi:hypothetical protein